MWYNDYVNLNNSEKERFRTVVNYLLNKTYMLREIFEQRDRVGKINADYRYVERNFELLESYLELAGYKVEKDDANGIISIYSVYEYNQTRLDKFTTLMSLTLRGVYDDAKEQNNSKSSVFVRVSDVVVKMLDDKLLLKKPTVKETSDALRILARHNVIGRFEGNLEDPNNCTITIYPTILKVVSNEKLNSIYNTLFKEFDDEVESVEFTN